MVRRHIFLFIILNLIWSNYINAQPFEDDTIRVACIGNSITFGARLDDPSTDAYPAVLQQMFGGKKVRVMNFGISGATMIRFGHPNVWQQLDNIKAFSPRVVIIIAGTNETVSGNRHNWEHIDDFENDYEDFLTQIKSLSSDPVIYICSPPDMNLKTPGLSQERLDDLTMRRPRLWELQKRIKKIARVSGVHFIDLTTMFKNKPELITPADGVHPNKKGYHVLALQIFKNIKHTLNQML